MNLHHGYIQYYLVGNVLYTEQTLITRGKHIIRGENIYYAEKTFITRRRHLLRRENIYYAEKTFSTWRRHVLLYVTAAAYRLR